MTTPEHFRRRQRIEGVIVILLAIFTVIQAVAFSLEDSDQRTCVERKFSELSEALEARSGLAARESEATRRVWAVYGEYAGIVKGHPNQELTPEDRERLQRQFVDALLNYQAEVKAVQRERRENPVPPYPVGSCDDPE